MASYQIEDGLDFCLVEAKRNFFQQDSHASLQVDGKKHGHPTNISSINNDKNKEIVFLNLDFDEALLS